MKTIYAGTGDIGLPSLEWLIETPSIELLAVICQPDKPVGRKQELTPPATKVLAEKHGIDVLQPARLRNDTSFIERSGLDLMIVMAYGQILPKPVLDAPRVACLNLHASILPKHRGASPIQAAIREGDAVSGVTVMYMDEGLDTGDILLVRSFELSPGETGGSLHDRLAIEAPRALAEAVDQLQAGAAQRIPQCADQASHCGKLTRQDGRIDWNLPAVEIERLIRAYDPWPGTSNRLRVRGTPDRTLKIFPPTFVPDNHAPPQAAPGTIVAVDASGLIVQTGEGLLGMTEIQVEGKKRMPVETFLKGNPLSPGALLSADGQ